MTRRTNVVLLLPLIFAGVGTSCGTDGIDGPGADFQITPASLALLPGESAQLTATSSGSPIQVGGWVSVDPAIATVSQTGLVTAVTRGATTITASIGERQRNVDVGVIPDVRGLWDWTQQLGGSVTCNDTGSIRFDQASDAVAGAGVQIGVCSVVGRFFDSRSRIEVVTGGFGADSFSFVTSNGDLGSFENPFRCTYNGIVSRDDPPVMTGDVTCRREDTQIVGTWEAVSEIPVTSVLLAPQTIVRSGSMQLEPEVHAVNDRPLFLRPVTYTSATPSIVDVSTSGVAAGASVGAASVTATVAGVSDDGTIVVETVSFVSVESFMGSHTCGLATTGIVYCWGAGPQGEVGPRPFSEADCSGFECRIAPGAVSRSLTFASVTAGGFHSCGVATDGTAYCWGSNLNFLDFSFIGALGNDVAGTSEPPIRVLGGLIFASLSAGQVHTCGVATDGTGYCWGDNVNGRLGDGTPVTRGTPQMITGGIQWSKVSPGQDHTCGLATDGTTYCWGNNLWGQLSGTVASGGAESTHSPSPQLFRPASGAHWRARCMRRWVLETTRALPVGSMESRGSRSTCLQASAPVGYGVHQLGLFGSSDVMATGIAPRSPAVSWDF